MSEVGARVHERSGRVSLMATAPSRTNARTTSGTSAGTSVSSTTSTSLAGDTHALTQAANRTSSDVRRMTPCYPEARRVVPWLHGRTHDPIRTPRFSVERRIESPRAHRERHSTPVARRGPHELAHDERGWLLVGCRLRQSTRSPRGSELEPTNRRLAAQARANSHANSPCQSSPWRRARKLTRAAAIVP